MRLQQGDVLIKEVEEIPEGLTFSKTNTLQYGELTGHAHRLHEGEFEIYLNPKEQDKDGNGRKYLRVVRPTELRHEEHRPFIIHPGIYEIGIVKEYDHFEEIERRVAD